MSTQSNKQTKTNGAANDSAPSTVPKWLKAELFEDLLKETVSGYKQIKTFNAVPGSSAGENFATIMLRIIFEVELNDGTSRPMSFMLKLPRNSEMDTDAKKENNVFIDEYEMYTIYVPEMEQLYRDAGVEINFGAKCYKIDAPTDYVLVEDLSPRGFKNANRLEALDKEHVQCALRVLAQWHASSAVRVATRGSYPFLNGFFREESRPMMEEGNKCIFKYFYESMLTYEGHESYADEVVAFQAKYVDVIFKSFKYDPNEFNALNHGDFWCNNIMFQYDDFEKIKQTYLIDYQAPKYGSVTTDLFYFLISSTRLEDKISKFDYFIKYYHDNLVEHLKLLNYTQPLPKLRDLHISLLKHGVTGYMAATGVMGFVLVEPTELASFENFVRDSEDGAKFKRLMYSNARYRKHIEKVMPWLVNRGTLDDPQ